ncbi:hypothetical protein ACIBCT_21410 [Streptosporangium sp. NPDC050855]|uniref:hypothetical protein n=1 Tax=Streptosporangium sp. NPDC050855 TaxID=3366194 RepID=UPI00378927DB
MLLLAALALPGCGTPADRPATPNSAVVEEQAPPKPQTSQAPPEPTCAPADTTSTTPPEPDLSRDRNGDDINDGRPNTDC